MLKNGHMDRDMIPLPDDTVEMRFKELYEMMEMYALDHQLAEFKDEVTKLINR